MNIPVHLGELLKIGDLQRLCAHAERLQRATKMLHNNLGPPLDQHCQVANIKEDKLVLHADSSAWAARLRFHVSTMLNTLGQYPEFSHIRAIRVKVQAL